MQIENKYIGHFSKKCQRQISHEWRMNDQAKRKTWLIVEN